MVSDVGINLSGFQLAVALYAGGSKTSEGDASGALADANYARASRTARPEATPAPLAEVNADIPFHERGFGFYWEHQRRTDMIRFEKYQDGLARHDKAFFTSGQVSLFPVYGKGQVDYGFFAALTEPFMADVRKKKWTGFS